MNNIESLANLAVIAGQKEDLYTARGYLVELFRVIHQSPNKILSISDYESIGIAYILMLEQRISNDEDILQIIANNAYYCTSKTIMKNASNPNYRKNRILVFHLGRDVLQHTVMAALHGDSMDIFSPSMQASWHTTQDDMRKMEFADLNSSSQLLSNQLFAQMKSQYENYFKNTSRNIIIQAGKLNHEKVFKYLENKYINNEDE